VPFHRNPPWIFSLTSQSEWRQDSRSTMETNAISKGYDFR
jgi:hypothetical protein